MVYRNLKSEFQLDGGNPSGSAAASGLTWREWFDQQPFADSFPGRPGAEWIGKLGSTDLLTVKSA